MANQYAETLLLEARQLMSTGTNANFELRKNNSSIVNAFMKYTDQVVMNLNDLKASTTNEAKLKYFKKITQSLVNDKSCTPSGVSGGTGSLTFSYLKKGFIAQVSEKIHDGNMVSMASALKMNLLDQELQFWFGTGGIDSVLATLLNTNRTQVNAISVAGVGHNEWDGINYLTKVAKADVSRFYNYAKSEMEANNYGGLIQEIHNTGWTAERMNYVNQGVANATNTAFQFEGIEASSTNHLVPDTYYMSKHFLVPAGALGFVTWNEPLNKRGQDLGDKQWGVYESQLFPGIYFDLMSYSTCSDTSADGGAKADIVHNYELVLNYYPFIVPLSNAGETPIFKYAVLA